MLKIFLSSFSKLNKKPFFLFSQNTPNPQKPSSSLTKVPSSSLEKPEKNIGKELEEYKDDEHRLIFEEKEENLMEDYTQSPTVMKFQEDSSSEFFPYKSATGFNMNTPSELQMKENPLALQILSEGKIDLKHKEIKLENANIQDLSLYSLEELKGMNENMAQINVGEIAVLPKNSILLEDIDVYNIPEDKDIVLNANKKKMIVMGHKVTRSVAGEEKGKENRGEFNVSRNVFEELNFDEFKKKYLFGFESKSVAFQKKIFLREVLRYWPIYLFFFFLFDTIFELYQVMSDHNLVVQQEMEIFNKIREKYMRDIVVSNDLYNRLNYK